MKSDGPILCFGEVLLRLSAPPGEKLSNAQGLSVHVGGAEANVAAMLAQLAHDCEMITVLPATPLGDLCEAELRRAGVGTSNSIRADGRMGLYFFERSSNGGGRIVYDRDDSAFARAADRFDWPALARGAGWFHLSGIDLAIGGVAARSALAALEAMRSTGATISFDVNHRSLLWEKRTRDDRDRLREIVADADVLFAGAADIGRILEKDIPGETADERAASARAAFAAFERLQVIASTRRSFDEGQPKLSVRIDTRDNAYETQDARVGSIVDRIGSGDAFAGGVIDGLIRGAAIEECASEGLAAAVMKHGLAGDRWVGTPAELEDFDPFTSGDIRR